MQQDGQGSKTPDVNPEAKEHWKKGNALFEANSFDEAVEEFSKAI